MKFFSDFLKNIIPKTKTKTKTKMTYKIDSELKVPSPNNENLNSSIIVVMGLFFKNILIFSDAAEIG